MNEVVRVTYSAVKTPNMVEIIDRGQLYVIYNPFNDAYLDLVYNFDDGQYYYGERDGSTLFFTVSEIEELRNKFKNKVASKNSRCKAYRYIVNVYEASVINDMRVVPVRVWNYRERVSIDTIVSWDVVETFHIQPNFIQGVEYLSEIVLSEGV